MAENSAIEWTDHTFNPWMGCTKVSDGCKNCYAETLMDKRYGKVKWGPQGTRIRTSAANWRKPLAWNRQAEKEGRRFRVFCASLADVFEDKPEVYPWREELFGLIGNTPNLDWLLLTKRPENVDNMFLEIVGPIRLGWEDFPNIWIGTSVENQEQYDKRVPELRNVPSAIRFLSMEPLLGPVEFGEHVQAEYDPELEHGPYSAFDWVIVGGESGHGKRPFNADWARLIRDQCQAAGVPFFMKQIDKIQPIPNDLMIREFPNEVTP